MTPAGLLTALRAAGLTVALAPAGLRVSPAVGLTPADRAALRTHARAVAVLLGR